MTDTVVETRGDSVGDVHVEPARPGFLATLRRPLALGGAIGALVAWWPSLYPTLMPRPALYQGLVSALAILFGYGVGVLVQVAGAAIGRRVTDVRVSRRAERIAWWVVGGLWVLLGVVGAVLWRRWQNDQRVLVVVPPLGRGAAIGAAVISVLVVALLLPVGRAIGFLVARLDAFAARFMPKPLANAVLAVLLVLGGVGITRRAVLDPLLRKMNDAFGTTNAAFTPPGAQQPTTPLRSGGPGSLVSWDSLGATGREFVGMGPTVDELQQFAGATATAKEPIRVYVGLDAGGSPDDKAALAVKELERTGAAERAVLGVVTVTGTGWVDPVAAEVLEYMHAGDTALVATQYSFLPSWISFLVDTQRAADNGKALVHAVRSWWDTLPKDHRPKLVIFGLSLGSYGSESAVAGPDAAASIAEATKADGVLWMGPTNANPVWRQIVAARDPGSPVWRPVYGGGTTVRFIDSRERLVPDDPTWKQPRVAYIAHPSDPVTWWDMPTMWSKPAWMRNPVGPDVPKRLLWFPFVTWTQVVVDLVNGFGASSGHGHNYNRDVVAGWSAVAPPAGWTEQDAQRLQHLLDLETKPAS